MPERARDEVVVVEKDGGGLQWFVLGALAGAALALLYAPASGEETRRMLRRRFKSLRSLADDQLDALVERLGMAEGGEADEDDDDEAVPARVAEKKPSARKELEQQLAERRAAQRARIDTDDDEAI